MKEWLQCGLHHVVDSVAAAPIGTSVEEKERVPSKRRNVPGGKRVFGSGELPRRVGLWMEVAQVANRRLEPHVELT